MASTYSTSLRLELMATGDQSGTWGTTTNTNLGTLLEQAITGVLSVAQGDVANLTLTTVNGGSDQARNAVVNLTGALTAQRNVVVQTANKLYLIKNSTTGGFSIIAKTAAGTGVTIPPASSQWVYSDGTNVVAGVVGNQSANAFLVGYTTTATAAGTTTLTVTSTQTQYFTGSTTQTITLPVVSTLVLGQEYEFVNLSTGALTINSSGGNLVTTVSANNTVRVQVILITGTTAASWQVIASSVPNPLTLSGSSVGYTPLVLTSTEAAAAAGPIENLFRDSASPAANDILAQLLWNGRDSAANIQEYASIQAVIVSPTSTTEASTLDVYVQKAGTRTLVGSFGKSPTLVTFRPQQAESPSTLYGVFGTRNAHPYLAFDAATNWNSIFTGVLPNQYYGNGLTVNIYWMAASATSGNVVWNAYIERDDVGTLDLDAASFAAAQTATTAANGTSGVLSLTTITFTSGAQMDSLAAGEQFRIKVERNAASGSDTMTGDAQITMVEVRET